MKVLLLESEPGAGDRARHLLEEAGHEVVRCHPSGLPAFPCRSLLEGDSCPLDRLPIDVVVTIRAHGLPRPSPFENGVTCALRNNIPLVVAGRTLFDPFDRWAQIEQDGDDDIVNVCERAARPTRR